MKISLYVQKIIVVVILFTCNQAYSIPKNAAVLIILDKITAKTKRVTIPINKNLIFKSIDIKVIKCDKSPPEDIPESATFLIIKEFNNTIFKGWMFSSNPSINSLEHSTYDVWIKNCTN